jgi:replicative DNA helicase
MTKAEKALLGALILDSRKYRDAAKLVQGSDFTTVVGQKVFQGIGEMVSQGLPVDQITVSNRWAEWDIQGTHHAVVHDWVEDAKYISAANEYASAVRNDSLRRTLRLVAESIMQRSSDSGIEALDIATQASNMLEQLRSGATSGVLEAKLLSEILEGDDAYDWLIPGLLERQDRLIVTGPEGFGKTTFIRQIAILAAAGINPMTFDRIKPIRVLVVDAENTERQWRRAVRGMSEMAASLGSADPRKTIHVSAGKRIDLTKGSHLSEIHQLVDIHKPDMLMIGPLYKLVPRAIQTDDDATPLIVALDSLRERGLCLIMEAHAGKSVSDGGERDLRPRGSAALLGWPEFGFGLRPMGSDPNMVTLSRWRGDRDERSWPKKLRRGGRWPWIPNELYESKG